MFVQPEHGHIYIQDRKRRFLKICSVCLFLLGRISFYIMILISLQTWEAHKALSYLTLFMKAAQAHSSPILFDMQVSFGI